jgi:ribosome-associated protein
MNEFVLESDYIELVKLLKLQGLADTGGQSKQMISDGNVLLNGEPELRKRAKLRPGDVVEAAGVSIRIVAASAR